MLFGYVKVRPPLYQLNYYYNKLFIYWLCSAILFNFNFQSFKFQSNLTFVLSTIYVVFSVVKNVAYELM